MAVVQGMPVSNYKAMYDEAVRNEKRLGMLLKVELNSVCADCANAINLHSAWASVNLGVFLCIGCAGLHRSLGTHLSKVRSATADEWNDDWVDNMIAWGNARAAAYWESVPLPPGRPDRQDLKAFIKAKYEVRAFAPTSCAPDEWLSAPCVELERGWLRYCDEASNSFYYYNEETEATVWDMPEEARGDSLGATWATVLRCGCGGAGGVCDGRAYGGRVAAEGIEGDAHGLGHASGAAHPHSYVQSTEGNGHLSGADEANGGVEGSMLEQLYAGWLVKAAPQRIARSRQRWFVLTRPHSGGGGQLRYYEDPESKEVKGVIDLRGLRPEDVQRLKPGTSNFTFAIRTPGRRWILDPGTEETYRSWHSHLTSMLMC